MATNLVVYGTGDGQTAKVSGRVAATLARRGYDPAVADVGQPHAGLPVVGGAGSEVRP